MDRPETHALALRRRAVLRPVVFAAAAATLPAARALARSSSMLLFFDWDSTELSATARERMAIAFARVGTTDMMGTIRKIEVQAHTDRSGPEAYNLHLSARRAEVVQLELLRMGMARDDLTLAAYGESRPLVPTPDGQREPRNRRVELVLR